MKPSEPKPVGVTMRPDFLRFVHDQIARGEDPEGLFVEVPVFSDPTLGETFRVFYDPEEFDRAVRRRVISGDSVRLQRPEEFLAQETTEP